MEGRKKESQCFSLRMDSAIFEKLEEYCKRNGATKTKTVERALTALFDEDEKKQLILRQALEK